MRLKELYTYILHIYFHTMTIQTSTSNSCSMKFYVCIHKQMCIVFVIAYIVYLMFAKVNEQCCNQMYIYSTLFIREYVYWYPRTVCILVHDCKWNVRIFNIRALLYNISNKHIILQYYTNTVK